MGWSVLRRSVWPLIAGVADAIAISATATRGCALGKDHRVLCWEGTAPATAISFIFPL